MAEPRTPMHMALRKLRAQRVAMQVYRNYYSGNHRLAFASEKFRNAFGRLFCEFSDNLCPAVVDAVADRLEVTGFAVEEGPAGAAKDAMTIWKKNRMRRQAKDFHREALKMGNGYVIVWPHKETGDPIIYPQKPELMTAVYDEEEHRELLYAAKVWLEGTRVRMNMYYPDRVEKYKTISNTTQIPEKPGAFAEWRDPGDESWPIMHDFRRVPVFHVGNSAAIGNDGTSELDDIIPLQDALNKSVLDMMVAMEFGALPQRWAVGLEVEIDEKTGKPKIPFQPGIDRLWAAENPDVKFGEFQAAALGQFIEVQNEFRMEIARVSSTPLHYIMMTQNPPSGEALQAMEERFLKKVLSRHEIYGEFWADVVAFCHLLATGSEVMLSTMWRDPAPHSALQQSQTMVNKKQVDVPRKQLWREMGYSEKQIEQMEKDRKAEVDEKIENAQRQMPTGPSDNPNSGRGAEGRRPGEPFNADREDGIRNPSPRSARS